MDKNNFDGVRIGLALIVTLSHIGSLTQLPEFRFLEVVVNSNFAVKGFFAISGFLVTKSYLSSKSLGNYIEKRARRIYPGYLCVILFCLLIGTITTHLPLTEFFLSGQTWRYLASNLVFLNFLQPGLPGALEQNALPALNGSLWTIKIEVMLYACVPFMVYLARKSHPALMFLVLYLASVAWVYYFRYQYEGAQAAELARQFPGQLAYFCTGALLATVPVLMQHLRWLALASLIALFAISSPHARLLLDPIAYAVIVIFLSTSACRDLNLGKFGDVSYGIYLYHFPIAQLLIAKGAFALAPWISLFATVALTWAAAWLSWHYIEQPWLKRRLHTLEGTPSTV